MIQTRRVAEVEGEGVEGEEMEEVEVVDEFLVVSATERIDVRVGNRHTPYKLHKVLTALHRGAPANAAGCRRQAHTCSAHTLECCSPECWGLNAIATSYATTKEQQGALNGVLQEVALAVSSRSLSLAAALDLTLHPSTSHRPPNGELVIHFELLHPSGTSPLSSLPLTCLLVHEVVGHHLTNFH